MQCENWTMKANFLFRLFFEDSLGNEKYSFLKKQYKQMMLDPLQSHPGVCDFYAIYAISFQIPRRTKYWFSRCWCTLKYKYIHVKI